MIAISKAILEDDCNCNSAILIHYKKVYIIIWKCNNVDHTNSTFTGEDLKSKSNCSSERIRPKTKRHWHH